MRCVLNLDALRRQVGAGHASKTPSLMKVGSRKVRFALDSSLEEAGFELTVPGSGTPDFAEWETIVETLRASLPAAAYF
jgi:hypothetical protein